MLNALEQHDASLDAHAEIYSISNTVVVNLLLLNWCFLRFITLH